MSIYQEVENIFNKVKSASNGAILFSVVDDEGVLQKRTCDLWKITEAINSVEESLMIIYVDEVKVGWISFTDEINDHSDSLSPYCN